VRLVLKMGSLGSSFNPGTHGPSPTLAEHQRLRPPGSSMCIWPQAHSPTRNPFSYLGFVHQSHTECHKRILSILKQVSPSFDEMKLRRRFSLFSLESASLNGYSFTLRLSHFLDPLLLLHTKQMDNLVLATTDQIHHSEGSLGYG